MRMIRLLALCLTISVLPAATPGLGQATALPERNISYDIQAKLDPVAKTVEAQQVLNWRNSSDTPVREFHFHLYLNAFRNNRSTMMWELSFAPFWRDRDPIPDDYWGFIDVGSIQVEADGRDGPTRVVSRRFIHPDDDNAEDRTVLQVELDRPLAPGEQVRFRIEFTSKLPRGARRTGWVEDYYFGAQWFPKLGVFSDGAWYCHQYHRHSEFFADFGDYEVSLTVPSDMVVGATGRLVAETDNGDGTRTHRFQQENVHDFTWVASSRLLPRTRRFEHPGLPSVDLRLLLLEEHEHLEERYFRAMEHSLRLFGTWFGPYPYSILTLVDPPYNSRTGGMEYPTLVTGRTDFWSPPETLSPEGVTIHEVAHQWWYGLVATNEAEEAWLDEGITSWATDRAAREAYAPRVHVEWLLGEIPLSFPSVTRPFETRNLAWVRRGGRLDVMTRNSWSFRNRRSYFVNAYAKPDMVLWTLERYLGAEVMLRAIRTWFERYRYRHPTTEDFVRTVSEVAGEDLDWFFRETIHSAETVDYAVTEARSVAVPGLKGVPPGEAEIVEEVTVAEGGESAGADGAAQSEAEAPVPDQEPEVAGEVSNGEETPPKKVYWSRVVVTRLHGARFPVDVVMEFEDGKRFRRLWDGQYRWVRYEFKRPSRLKSAVVDPDRKLLLDINPTNNSRLAKPPASGGHSLATRKWTAKWLFWLQNLMEIFALIS